METLRSVALLARPLILAAALALLVPSASAQNCPDFFSLSTGNLGGYGNTVQVEINVDENTQPDEELYTLSWKECVDPPQMTDSNFTKYFTVDDTTNCTWVVSVNEMLTGVPDYPNPQTTIETVATFTGFSSISPCIMTLKHNIMDENTQNPVPDSTLYTWQIYEDFTSGYPISTYVTPVQDKDGTSPNNQFSVTVDDPCPLEATEQTYTSGGNVINVEYKLKQKLDYETEPWITCNVIFEDKGNSPLSDTAVINIDVQDVDDEPPVFTSNFYYADVDSVAAIGDPLPVKPSDILAIDGDRDLNYTITYTLTNADENVDGLAYFEIDQNTGTVTLTKDLDPDFLLNERVLFFVTASDGSLTSTAVLEVTLPPLPTTTASTIPATTCEPCTCPTYTTETPTECPTPSEISPCPTETITECPTTPTEGTTITKTTTTHDPNLPTLKFKKDSYLGDIQSTFTEVFQVEVEDIDSEVTYSLIGPSRDETLYFIINPSSGWISVNKDNPPDVGKHQLGAVATLTTAPSETTTTRVTINVMPLASTDVTIVNSIMRFSTVEGKEETNLGNVDLSAAAQSMCVIAADPKDMRESFTLEPENENKTTWILKKLGALDHEETQEITLTIQAYDEEVKCSSTIETDIPKSLLRSQALVIINVTDMNDELPTFSSDALVVAYPSNEGLSRVVGPVVVVQAVDKDSENLVYSLTGKDAAKFTVDEATGDVYSVGNLNCNQECEFNLTASDEINEDTINVKVLSLEMDHIFTILMTNTGVSEVDAELSRLSDIVGVQISKLYVSPMESTTRLERRTRYRRQTTMSLEVHVYSIKDGALMSLDDLNSALSNSTTLQAAEFAEAKVFVVIKSSSNDNTTGLTVAVAVLGSLLGLVLIAGVFFFVHQKKKSKDTPRSPKPMNTLGNAYQNQSYTPDHDGHTKSSGSVGHKSNGSINGFTSAQVHRHEDQESPPLNRSPLSPPSDSIPLRTTESQQQGGLRRTDLGAPEYYGSSTPSPPPPPYFSTSRDDVASSSSSHIYSEIKKPKDPKPKSGMNVPMIDFAASSVDKKDPAGKFSAVKGSPPPRRSNRQIDEDDEDENEGVTYPGGKKTRFNDEPADDEKKSVAFKVMVDTKEIEAENIGPAQRRAEAEKLMEKNRKKLEEEDDENEEDDASSAKL